ncbi:LAMI_0E01200g1_1 [Lachancea mirantina]|uniref:LAMI_0E01200g1_1 n=1 Tax=Lachancea mirantina TaxID=1230905 RepID=A0A1G4JIV5_9SACH|nr:LAMI_0E01200g1_1 [Lachancea mirantina]
MASAEANNGFNSNINRAQSRFQSRMVAHNGFDDSRNINGRDVRNRSRYDDRGYEDDRRSCYGNSRGPKNFRNESRYRGSSRPRSSHYNRTQEIHRGRQLEPNWDEIIPIDQRVHMRLTKWDVTPKGFENVPAERAKLSGLFPLPGQPQDIDKSKLEGIVSSGALTRRTRVLFEDLTATNMAAVRANRRLILTSLDANFACDQTVIELIAEFARDLESVEEYELLRGKWLEDRRLLLEFSKEEAVTLVLACQKFIEKRLNTKFVWQRPGEFVQKAAADDPICGGKVIAVHDIQENDEETIRHFLTSKGIQISWLKLIKVGKGLESTQSVLFEPENEIQQLKDLKWSRPNDSKLKQNFTDITFQNLPRLVSKQGHEATRVLMLLNCIDPMDLKDDEFVAEIEDAMQNSDVMLSFGEIESVKIPVPSADYRMSFDTISDNVGKIYVKFKELQGAKNAMNKLAGSKFNDRTVLCSYFSERDYNMNVL